MNNSALQALQQMYVFKESEDFLPSALSPIKVLCRYGYFSSTLLMKFIETTAFLFSSKILEHRSDFQGLFPHSEPWTMLSIYHMYDLYWDFPSSYSVFDSGFNCGEEVSMWFCIASMDYVLCSSWSVVSGGIDPLLPMGILAQHFCHKGLLGARLEKENEELERLHNLALLSLLQRLWVCDTCAAVSHCLWCRSFKCMFMWPKARFAKAKQGIESTWANTVGGHGGTGSERSLQCWPQWVQLLPETCQHLDLSGCDLW